MVVHTVEFVRAHYKIGIQFLFPFKKVRSSNSLHGNRMKVTKYLFKIRICVLQQVFIASACIIFRLNGGEKSKDAVLMSAASTAFSFLLLSFTSFKLISSLGLTLFIGITASYILSLFMIKSNHGTR